MMTPATAAGHFGIALVLGGILGAFYGFLRPLRPKLTGLADLIFIVGFFWAWLILGFGIFPIAVWLFFCVL